MSKPGNVFIRKLVTSSALALFFVMAPQFAHASPATETLDVVISRLALQFRTPTAEFILDQTPEGRQLFRRLMGRDYIAGQIDQEIMALTSHLRAQGSVDINAASELSTRLGHIEVQIAEMRRNPQAPEARSAVSEVRALSRSRLAMRPRGVLDTLRGSSAIEFTPIEASSLRQSRLAFLRPAEPVATFEEKITNLTQLTRQIGYTAEIYGHTGRDSAMFSLLSEFHDTVSALAETTVDLVWQYNLVRSGRGIEHLNFSAEELARVARTYISGVQSLQFGASRAVDQFNADLDALGAIVAKLNDVNRALSR